ncbi:MAG: nucleotidyltransferase family protein [Polyangiales bacterium]
MRFTDEQGVPIEPIDVAPIRARAEHALSMVLPALDRAGIPVLPVKGIITGRWLYRSAYERPMSDVDVRARRCDLARIRAVCERNSWRITNWSSWYQNVTFEVAGASIDVESTVGAPGMCSLTIESMLARARRSSELLSVEHWRPETHDHALLLAMNVLKDQVGRSFPWAIEDLVRVATVEDFAPAIMADRAWRTGTASALRGVARWLATAKGSAPWSTVAERIGEPPRPAYARRVERALSDLRDPASGALRTAFARSSNDLISQRILSFSALALWLPTTLIEREALRASERHEGVEQRTIRL